MLAIAVCIILMIGVSHAFFPNRLTKLDIGEGTLTHQDITEIGILKSVASYFEDNPRPGVNIWRGQLTEMEEITAMKLFKLYFPDSDEVTGNRLQATINSIVTANNMVNNERFDNATWHFNGELITKANDLLIELREQIIIILKQENANFDLAREMIGQFLHVMQMFYSNTNWIELYGSEAYYALGIRGKVLLPQASPDLMTCRSCGDLDGTPCNNTLIDNGAVLTSGYRSGQSIENFSKTDLLTRGKCSHGGPSDSPESTLAALGGINKDSVMTNLSPHYHLHQAAAQAAINHTTFFFNDEGPVEAFLTQNYEGRSGKIHPDPIRKRPLRYDRRKTMIEHGLRYIIGEDRFKQFFQLGPGASLVFTVDSTGSMSDEIEAVKQQVIAITRESLGTANEPSNYLIVLFNDPASLTTIFQTDSSKSAIDYTRKIKVSGGGDCPEYSIDGIAKALHVCNPNSRMFVFTDASAKDALNAQYVNLIAGFKNVQLNFLLTGSCGGRRRRAVTRQGARKRRSSHASDVYRALAAATGGFVFETSKLLISEVANIIKETRTASVLVLKRTLPSSGNSSDIVIPVDNTMQQLVIQISGTKTQHQLYDPSGDIWTNVTDLDVGKLIKINSPTRGVWRLVRLDSNPWNVTVVASATLDIMSSFVQTDPETGFAYEITGRPVLGENATVVMFVPSKDLIRSLDRIELLDTEGNEIAHYYNIQEIKGRADYRLYQVQFPLPTQAFQVSVSGEDSKGYRYKRLQEKIVVPVNMEMYLLPVYERLYVNNTMTLDFVIISKSERRSLIKVTVKDDQSFVQAPLVTTLTLNPNQNATGRVMLRSGSKPGIITTVTLYATSGLSFDDSSQIVLKRVITVEQITQPANSILPQPEQISWILIAIIAGAALLFIVIVVTTIACVLSNNGKRGRAGRKVGGI